MSEGVGEGLRRAREGVQLGIPEAAAQLLLDPAVLRALEEERFAELGAPVYARGHLRRYAEFLGLDADDVLRRYDARGAQDVVEPDLTHVPRAVSPPDPRRYLWPAVIVAVLAVLASILWWALHVPPPQ